IPVYNSTVDKKVDNFFKKSFPTIKLLSFYHYRRGGSSPLFCFYPAVICEFSFSQLHMPRLLPTEGWLLPIQQDSTYPRFSQPCSLRLPRRSVHLQRPLLRCFLPCRCHRLFHHYPRYP